MTPFTKEDLLCLLEVLTDALQRDHFDALQDRTHAEELLTKIKQELSHATN